ncbi:hypothetical protein NPIL_523891 [Nephila pilipes]|uniref:Uncharacterized protein n=1 Tax=Nephila pilipes TaxID=299642 RepID=A0A8X6QD93_NEPPI|nr:hypothetical protein NPIL_523891 [Nephila pilipes]
MLYFLSQTPGLWFHNVNAEPHIIRLTYCLSLYSSINFLTKVITISFPNPISLSFEEQVSQTTLGSRQFNSPIGICTSCNSAGKDPPNLGANAQLDNSLYQDQR